MTTNKVKKFKYCPECGGHNLGDRWCRGRKLQQYCHSCEWKSEIRTPEKKKITNQRDLRIDEFYGWSYILYDRYGHVTMYSATHNSEKKARKEMEGDMQRMKSLDETPITGVLFFVPFFVTIKGKMYKLKNNKLTKV